MRRLPTLRHTLLSTRDLLVTAGPFVLLVVALLALAYWALDPSPPQRVVLATGSANGAYAEFGLRYQAQLKKYGIQVELRNTEGSAENLALLTDPGSGVDFAFVQGGAGSMNEAEADAASAPALVSLGSLFYEPLWLFYREASAQKLLGRDKLDTPGQLTGWRVNIGAPGSGITNLMRRVLDSNGLASDAIAEQRLSQTPAVMGLLAGEIDALALVSAPEAPMVQMLLQTPGIRLMDFAQAEAYSRRLPMLAAVELPRGVVSLERDLPPQGVDLVAPTAMLVARRSAHPALQQLFVQAANTIHSGAGWFQKRGEFPNRRASELPMSKEADRFFDTGPPMLQRYLPFWVANLVDRMWVVLASIVVVLIPLSRVLPPLYELRIRSRVFRWYGKLRQIEESLADNLRGQGGAQPLMNELDELDTRVRGLQVPLSHADELYALRSHIDLVRKKLRALGAQTPTASPS
ncbi:TAXI family TRAP transporter solute-binding subunit [Methylibium sp.]|uniref:TAXI family TRAP transporter solute-binding subunit n=1 Tax=Methylibium sp. TaxID=2067992 RepID=UPI00286A7EE6|nr:TAXI family TRAP transporter solute-binding subunit [Methylibium sp.]